MTPKIVVVAAWVTVIGTVATVVLHLVSLRRR
jgi:hypothetical protein